MGRVFYIVYREPQRATWGVYETSTGYNRLVEGGFFSKAAAEQARDRWQREGY